MGVEIEGIAEVLHKLGKLGDQGTKVENAALRSAGDVVKEAIQREAPVDTGTLCDNIRRTGVRTTKDGIKSVLVYAHEQPHVARFLEFGTVKMRPNPFMSRGYEQSKTEAMALLAAELRKGLLP